MKLLRLNNSALSTLLCDKKFQHTVINGYYSAKDTVALFGDAYHKCIEHIDKNEPPVEVVKKVFADAPAVDKAKLLKLLIQTRENYKPKPPLVINDIPVIEYKFDIPYTTRTLCTGEELQINLSGTIDNTHIDNNILVIVDYKTSPVATDYLVTKTINEYQLAFQLPFYLYALYKGILPAAEKATYLLTNHYRLELWLAFYNMSSPFKKIIKPAFNTHFLETIIPTIINQQIDRIVNIYNRVEQKLPIAYNGFNVYGACANCTFRPACLVAGSAREDELLSYYPTRIYDPRNFR